MYLACITTITFLSNLLSSIMADNSRALVLAPSVVSDIRAAARNVSTVAPALPARGGGFWNLDRELKLVEVKTAECKKVESSRKYKLKSAVVKWEYVATEIEKLGVTGQKGEPLKRKWTNMSSDYRKINDWNKRSGACSWWDMSSQERKEADLRLVKGTFEQELFDKMNGLLDKRHSVHPPIILDTENMGEDKKDDDHVEFSTFKSKSESSSGKNRKKESAEEKPSVKFFTVCYS